MDGGLDRSRVGTWLAGQRRCEAVGRLARVGHRRSVVDSWMRPGAPDRECYVLRNRRSACQPAMASISIMANNPPAGIVGTWTITNAGVADVEAAAEGPEPRAFLAVTVHA